MNTQLFNPLQAAFSVSEALTGSSLVVPAALSTFTPLVPQPPS